MRKATEREQEFFNRVAQNPWVQWLHTLFAMIGLGVTWALVITIGGVDGTVSVVQTVGLVVGGMVAGYVLARIRA